MKVTAFTASCSNRQFALDLLNFGRLNWNTHVSYGKWNNTLEYNRLSWWPPYWPTGRLADNQKMRNLTDNLSKMSNKTYSEAAIGQFKTRFRKRTLITQFFHQLV